MNGNYLTEPEIYRPPAPALDGPTIETYMDRPSVRPKRKKMSGKPGATGGNRPCVVEIETGRKWKSGVDAANALGIPQSTMQKALAYGREIDGKRYEYGPAWSDVIHELERGAA